MTSRSLFRSIFIACLAMAAFACDEERQRGEPEALNSTVWEFGLLPTDLPNVQCNDGTRLSASLDGFDGTSAHVAISASTSSGASISGGGWFAPSSPPSSLGFPTIAYSGIFSQPPSPGDITQASQQYDAAITQQNCPMDLDSDPSLDAGTPGDGGPIGLPTGSGAPLLPPGENPPCNTEYTNYNSARWGRTAASTALFISAPVGFIGITVASFNVANTRRTFAACCDIAEGTAVQANWTSRRCLWLYNHSWPFDPHG